MAKAEKQQNPSDVELPQSIIESFARFLVPEIRKFYVTEEGQREFKKWEQQRNNHSKE